MNESRTTFLNTLSDLEMVDNGKMFPPLFPPTICGAWRSSAKKLLYYFLGIPLFPEKKKHLRSAVNQ